MPESFRDKIFFVERVSGRLIAIMIYVSNETVNVVTAHAAQIGCSDDKKEEFWQDFGNFVSTFSRMKVYCSGQIYRKCRTES